MRYCFLIFFAILSFIPNNYCKKDDILMYKSYTLKVEFVGSCKQIKKLVIPTIKISKTRNGDCLPIGKKTDLITGYTCIKNVNSSIIIFFDLKDQKESSLDKGESFTFSLKSPLPFKAFPKNKLEQINYKRKPKCVTKVDYCSPNNEVVEKCVDVKPKITKKGFIKEKKRIFILQSNIDLQVCSKKGKCCPYVNKYESGICGGKMKNPEHKYKQDNVQHYEKNDQYKNFIELEGDQFIQNKLINKEMDKDPKNMDCFPQLNNCTNLCLKQNMCPVGLTTTLSGKIRTPGGETFPNTLIYIPNEPVSNFKDEIECKKDCSLISGNPLVHAFTDVEGNYFLNNVPVDTNLPLIVQRGKWRRQLVIPNIQSCASNSLDITLPSNQNEGDIPKIAIITHQEYPTECIFKLLGISENEITSSLGNGRIHLFKRFSDSPDVVENMETMESLLNDTNLLHSYEMIIFNCPIHPYNPLELSQFTVLLNYVNQGGKLYLFHLEFPLLKYFPFSSTVTKFYETINNNAIYSINTNFVKGKLFADWLHNVVKVGTTYGKFQPSEYIYDPIYSVNPSVTQTWAIKSNTQGILSYSFDTPLHSSSKCGKVFFQSSHPFSEVDSLSYQCPNLKTGDYYFTAYLIAEMLGF